MARRAAARPAPLKLIRNALETRLERRDVTGSGTQWERPSPVISLFCQCPSVLKQLEIDSSYTLPSLVSNSLHCSPQHILHFAAIVSAKTMSVSLAVSASATLAPATFPSALSEVAFLVRSSCSIGVRLDRSCPASPVPALRLPCRGVLAVDGADGKAWPLAWDV
jgi:hypothetical protein